jgi:tripartite-type tricarboxylate transporter receptor subunit TctC
MRTWHVTGWPLAIALIAASNALAQNYPVKLIRMVVPSPAGGPVDFVGRTIGQNLSEAWRQPVIVDNRPGAGGVSALEQVTKTPADGYTLLLSAMGVVAIAPAMFKAAAEMVRDLEPVSMAVYVPNILVVNVAVPAKNVKELIALAKARPGKVDYSSAGNGSPAHLAGEVFKSLSRTDIHHVPYKGAAQALTAVVSGEVGMMFSPVTTALPFVKSGRLRVLGITTKERSPVLPDVAPIAELGVPGYEVVQWFAIFVRSGTPRDIVTKLNAEVGRILKLPDITEKLAAQGANPVSSTPEQLDKFWKSELVKWAKVIKESGATVD